MYTEWNLILRLGILEWACVRVYSEVSSGCVAQPGQCRASYLHCEKQFSLLTSLIHNILLAGQLSPGTANRAKTESVGLCSVSIWTIDHLLGLGERTFGFSSFCRRRALEHAMPAELLYIQQTVQTRLAEWVDSLGLDTTKISIFHNMPAPRLRRKMRKIIYKPFHLRRTRPQICVAWKLRCTPCSKRRFDR